MRSTLLLAALIIASRPLAAAEAPERRDCTFERLGRPAVASSCTVKSGVLAGIVDATIRLDDGKALHLEGPLGPDDARYRLQGGFAHRRVDERADIRCYERDDGGMTLCLGRRIDAADAPGRAEARP